MSSLLPFSFDALFSGGVYLWRGGGQDGMQALLSCYLHPTVAPAKELVPNLQNRRFCYQPTVYLTERTADSLCLQTSPNSLF